MAQKFNFKLNDQPLSKASKANGLTSFIQLCNHIKHLPYGRIKNRGDYTSILKEKKGTCSTKHAFLKLVAIENNINNIHLYIGIYKMNETNTPGVGTVLNKYNLDYIPEAHTYLKVDNLIVDITRITTPKASFKDSLINEIQIHPKQIVNFKVKYHQDFLKQWLINKDCLFDFNKIWEIREACIANL